jgi:hypothetical protein
MQNIIKLDEFLGKVNAYQLSFMDKTITGRLIEQNGDFIKIQLRSGNIICCHIGALRSIWHIKQPEVA